jgi:hypothetical protein
MFMGEDARLSKYWNMTFRIEAVAGRPARLAIAAVACALNGT